MRKGSGVMITDSTLMSDGVMMSDNILVSYGAMMSDGSPFLSCGVMMNDGAMMTDDTLVGDGVMLSGVAVQASKAMIYGDNTTKMSIVAEASLPPNTPLALTAAIVSKSQINLSWADNSADETGFKVERSTDGQLYTQLATVAAGVKTYASTGLTASKKYYFRVRAYNANGNSAYTSVASATTPSK